MKLTTAISSNQRGILLNQLSDNLLNTLVTKKPVELNHLQDRAAFITRIKRDGIPQSLASVPGDLNSYFQMPGFQIPTVTTDEIELLKQLDSSKDS